MSRQASAVGGEHSRKEPFKQLVNSYSEYLLYIWACVQRRMLVTWLTQCMCYMNLHEPAWTALGCRPNSTCNASAKHLPAAKTSGTCKSTYSLSRRTDHVVVTTMKRLDQGHPHPKLEVPGLTPSMESNPGIRGGEVSTLENNHSNILLSSCLVPLPSLVSLLYVLLRVKKIKRERERERERGREGLCYLRFGLVEKGGRQNLQKKLWASSNCTPSNAKIMEYPSRNLDSNSLRQNSDNSREVPEGLHGLQST
jgi:hypothetical protein